MTRLLPASVKPPDYADLAFEDMPRPQDGRAQTRRNRHMRHLITCSLVLLAAAAIIDPVGRHDPKDRLTWWIILGVITATVTILLSFYLWIYYRDDIKPQRPRTINDIHAVSEVEAYKLQKIASKIHLNAIQARIFAIAILEPAELRQRVVEQYVPNERTLGQEVTVEALIPTRLLATDTESTQPTTSAPTPMMADPVQDLPTEASQENFDFFAPRATWPVNDAARPAANPDTSVLFPLLVVPKGAFNDNLGVFGFDDRHIPILTYGEYLQLTAGILRLLLCRAYGISSVIGAPQFPQEPSASAEFDVLHLEHLALCEIIKQAQPTRDVKTQGVSPVARRANEIADLLENLPVKDDEGRVYLKLAAALVRKLSLHYALVAVTDLGPDGRLLLRYRRTLIPELELSPVESDDLNLYRKLKGWLNTLFGARPVNVTVSLDNAWTCDSYHVRVDAPEGLYLVKQALIASQSYLSQKAANAPTLPHYRFRRRLGQSYAHFYGRYFPIPVSGERRPKIRLDFHEVPPGSDFRATIAGSASFGLIWLVGFVLSRTSDAGTDAPAFLLVFPGIAASWLGFDTTTRRLFDGTLAARLSLALTTLVSIAASGAFILGRSRLSLFDWCMPGGSSVLGVYKWPWAILTATAFLNTIYMGCRWLRHSWRFKHLAARPDPDCG